MDWQDGTEGGTCFRKNYHGKACPCVFAPVSAAPLHYAASPLRPLISLTLRGGPSLLTHTLAYPRLPSPERSRAHQA